MLVSVPCREELPAFVVRDIALILYIPLHTHANPCMPLHIHILEAAAACSRYAVQGADEARLNGVYVPCTAKVFETIRWHESHTRCLMLEGNTRTDSNAPVMLMTGTRWILPPSHLYVTGFKDPTSRWSTTNGKVAPTVHCKGSAASTPCTL